MKYSQLFGKTRKQIAQDAVSINHQLLVKGGFVDQLSAGIFTWLPLGLRVLRKIDTVIREELDAIGCNEVTMPRLIPKNNLEKGGRWEGVDVLFKLKSQTGSDYGLGFSHEEVVTPLAGQYIQSYKDLPLALYQIQTKFRDELRAKSGVLRGREFGMKDLYSFHKDHKDLIRFYKDVTNAYLKIFKRCGFNDVYITEASGGSFTNKNSHEFNILTPSGEVDLLYCEKCKLAENVEVAKQKINDTCLKCKEGVIKSGKAIEIGNIFDLGDKFSNAFNISFTDEKGVKQAVRMGCYGIGNTRLVGTIVELHHDDRGIIWPKEVAPFAVHLVSLPGGEAKAEELYQELTEKGIAVLWDDRDVSAGVKFGDSDLIGIPVRVVTSSKLGAQLEIKSRSSKEVKIGNTHDLLALLDN